MACFRANGLEVVMSSSAKSKRPETIWFNELQPGQGLRSSQPIKCILVKKLGWNGEAYWNERHGIRIKSIRSFNSNRSRFASVNKTDVASWGKGALAVMEALQNWTGHYD